ncbi:hypothetical protein EXN32_05565 [Agrobacterium tumefaciens]|nr:hypothetical protein EXN32_05565 [Agrobacterium tumefaciens]
MPRISGLCLAKPVLQPTNSRERERPTTNQIHSPQSLTEFPCQTPHMRATPSLTTGAGSKQKQNVSWFLMEHNQYNTITMDVHKRGIEKRVSHVPKQKTALKMPDFNRKIF